MAFPDRDIEPVVRSYRFGDFELDLYEETLLREGIKLNINRRIFQVLLLLIEGCGQIVTKREFFEKVWDGHFVEDNNLTVTITALRKVLGDDPREAKYIENLPRKGYRFIAPVRARSSAGEDIPDIASENGNAASASASSGPPSPRRRSVWLATAAVLIILALTTAAFVYRGYRTSPDPATEHVESIAVLPFKSADPNYEYMADGLTDGIINSLSRLSGVRVVDRNSAFYYKDKVVDPAEVSRVLGTRSVVTGRIELVDDMLIITAEAAGANAGRPLWQRQFRKGKSEMFAAQQEVARAISLELLSKAAGPDAPQFQKRPTDNAEAYDLYLKGRYYWNKRDNPDIVRSIELFRAAVDKDPTFARAYVGLGNAYSLVDLKNAGIDDNEKIVLAQAAARKALEIDDSIGEAYAVIGINKVYHEWDLAGAESSYRRAIELNPSDATARHWYGELLAMSGRFDESYRQYNIAMSLDPLSLPIRTDMGLAHYYARDYDTAIEILNRAKALDPDYGRTYEFLGFAYRENGMLKESVDCIEKNAALQLQSGQRTKESYDAWMKYTAELRKAAAENGEIGYWRVEKSSGPPDTIYRAVACSKLGESDKAFQFLEEAYKKHYTGMIVLEVLPELDGIRQDPRYQDLLRRIGFRLD